jgi:sec-independent protein translocase protein TatB
MLDFGFSEILLTSAIALVVLGPERLPKVARQVGHWMGRARSMARQLHEQLEREVSADELLKETTRAANNVVADRIAPPPPPLAPLPTGQPWAATPSPVEAAAPAYTPPHGASALSLTQAPQAVAPSHPPPPAGSALAHAPEAAAPAYARPEPGSPDAQGLAQSSASHRAPGAPASNPPNE